MLSLGFNGNNDHNRSSKSDDYSGNFCACDERECWYCGDIEDCIFARRCVCMYCRLRIRDDDQGREDSDSEDDSGAEGDSDDGDSKDEDCPGGYLRQDYHGASESEDEDEVDDSEGGQE